MMYTLPLKDSAEVDLLHRAVSAFLETEYCKEHAMTATGKMLNRVNALLTYVDADEKRDAAASALDDVLEDQQVNP